MTIDPYSSSSIRDSVLQLASSQLQNAHADVKSRNDHIHAAKEDYQAGDVKGAEEEQQAALSDQQTFREYLRELARGAIRVVVEDVMREELDVLIGGGV